VRFKQFNLIPLNCSLNEPHFLDAIAAAARSFNYDTAQLLLLSSSAHLLIYRSSSSFVPISAKLLLLLLLMAAIKRIRASPTCVNFNYTRTKQFHNSIFTSIERASARN
jgi:hypothetical protein